MKFNAIFVGMAFLVLKQGVVVCKTTVANPMEKQAAPPKERCLEFFYYDHGTEHCEHCRDICHAATAKGTMTQCWTLCQSYAHVLWPPHPTRTPATVTPKPLASSQDKKDDNPQLILKIAIPLLTVVLIVGAAYGLIIIRCRTSAQKNRLQRQIPEQTATLELLSQTAAVEIPDAVGDGDVMDGSVVGGSARATCGTEASISTTGVQEEGARGGPDQGSQAGGRGTTVAQTMQNHLYNVPISPGSPIPVTPEGDSAPFAMALISSAEWTGRSGLHNIPTGAHQMPPSASICEPEVDLDSTERKSLLPSMNDNSM